MVTAMNTGEACVLRAGEVHPLSIQRRTASVGISTDDVGSIKSLTQNEDAMRSYEVMNRMSGEDRRCWLILR